MENGEEWVLRPVVEGMCRYESLLEGKIDLFDIARMNAALDVRDENTSRARKAIDRD
jgi:hypothetical protein